jgi:hypothetical protein
MVFYPAGEVHSQQFGSSGSSKLIFVPTAPSLEFLSDRGVILAQAPHVRSAAIAQLARRVVAEKRHDDIFSELTITSLPLELIAEFGRLDKNEGTLSRPSRNELPGDFREADFRPGITFGWLAVESESDLGPGNRGSVLPLHLQSNAPRHASSGRRCMVALVPAAAARMNAENHNEMAELAAG